MISVLMASYNYEHFMGKAIQSVLGQSFRDLELIIVDDGSRDNSVKLAHAFARKDARVRVMVHPDGKNHGLPATLSLGLSHACGEWVAFLESDDIWRLDCLEKRLKLAEKTGSNTVFNAIAPLPMPGADTAWFDSYIFRVMKEHRQRGESAFSLRSDMLVENKIPTFSCAMVRADILRACSFDSPVSRWLDWWIWTQVAQESHFAFLPERTTLWRLHSGSFNHKVSFSCYLRDCSSMWQGFRKILGPFYELNGCTGPLCLLYYPFWMRLLVRFAAIIRQEGSTKTVRHIFRKLK